MKKGEFCHFWAESQLGIGTKQGWYRYHLCRGKMVLVPSKVVPIPLSRTSLVPVRNIVVPVPLVPATPVFGIFAYLSSNLHTESIRTLIND